MINISGPTTLTLSPSVLATILDALAEVPYRNSRPAFDEILSQLQPKEPQNEQPSTSSRGPIPATNGNSDSGSNSALNGAGVRSDGTGSEIRDSDRCGGESTGTDHQRRNDVIPPINAARPSDSRRHGKGRKS